MSRIALNLRKLASRKDAESREVQEDLRALTVLRTPVAQLYNLQGASPSAPPNENDHNKDRKRPPPLPAKKKRTAEGLPSMASPPSAFPSTRVGLATTAEANRSSALFLVAIALAILTMSAIALAVVVPTSEWAFLGG